MNTRFKSHGYEYEVDDLGAIHQLNPQPFTYDRKYNSTYDTPAYIQGNELLQGIRLGFIKSLFPDVNSIVDFGAGNGAFCKFARRYIPDVWAYDVDSTNIEGVQKTTSPDKVADLYTFHDSLEHVPDLSFLSILPTNNLVISLPWCHYHTMGLDWFNNEYPHRKPNEHLHHFNQFSLVLTLAKHGWSIVGRPSNHEDIVRHSKHGLSNILTIAFTR